MSASRPASPASPSELPPSAERRSCRSRLCCNAALMLARKRPCAQWWQLVSACVCAEVGLQSTRLQSTHLLQCVHGSLRRLRSRIMADKPPGGGWHGAHTKRRRETPCATTTLLPPSSSPPTADYKGAPRRQTPHEAPQATNLLAVAADVVAGAPAPSPSVQPEPLFNEHCIICNLKHREWHHKLPSATAAAGSPPLSACAAAACQSCARPALTSSNSSCMSALNSPLQVGTCNQSNAWPRRPAAQYRHRQRASTT